MHKAKGYVVVAATPVQFPATVETIIVPKTLYKVTVSFGNKTIYLDPKDGKSAMAEHSMECSLSLENAAYWSK